MQSTTRSWGPCLRHDMGRGRPNIMDPSRGLLMARLLICWGRNWGELPSGHIHIRLLCATNNSCLRSKGSQHLQGVLGGERISINPICKPTPY